MVGRQIVCLRLSPACDRRVLRDGGGNECHGQGDRWALVELPGLPDLGGVWSLGLGGYALYLSSSAGCLCGPGGWDASDSGSFLLACFPTQPLLPRGEGNGRAEEGGLARPSVQPGLGTLPKAPKTMLGMEAGLGQRQALGGA